MSGYFVAQVQVEDREVYQQYVDGVFPILRKYDGEVLVAHDDVDVLEGAWNPQRTIVLKFPSVERAREWYESPEYQEHMKLRLQSSQANAIIVKGLR